MAASEQPPKKRRLYEAMRTEDVQERQRNKDEIRSVYECYNRIKFCLSHKKRDSSLSPDLEHAYRSLISASRGCTSVQRIVADLIPRYASHCPNAFEAASKVVMDMHNCSVAVINNGKDSDDTAFETAKSCILGLSDICCTACLEAPNSPVIWGISSSVLQNVLTFYVSSFDGNDMFRVFGKEIVKVQDSADKFDELKQLILDGKESELIVLFKLRALSLFRIFFCYPKSLLAACFDLFNTTALEGAKMGLQFLSLLTRKLDIDEAISTCSIETSTGGDDVFGEKPSSAQKPPSDSTLIPDSCFLTTVLHKDPSLKLWICSMLKRILQSSSSNNFSDIKSEMEGLVESVTKITGVDVSQMETDVNDSNPSEPINPSSLKLTIPSPHETSIEPIGSNSRARGVPSDGGDHGDILHGKSSTPRDSMNPHNHSPVTRTPPDFRSKSFDGRNHTTNQSAKMDFRSPNWRSGGNLGNPFASPKHHLANNPNTWHFDGDPAAMDIFYASKQLRVSHLGPDTSEAHIRFEFERFGPIEQFIPYPMKGFCVVDYRNIFDAIKARDYLRRQFHWHINFTDSGLSTSCLVYIGNVTSHWERDEFLHESRRVLYRGRSTVTDLKNEGALLMELETPEEASAVITHLRQVRQEKSNHQQQRVHHGGSFSGRSESHSMELVSPRVGSESHGSTDTNMAVDSSHGGSHACVHPGPPQPQIQTPQYMRPAYVPPNCSWDSRGSHQNYALPILPLRNPNNIHSDFAAAPFAPSTMAPLSQPQGPPLQHFCPSFSLPPPPPPPPEMPPPLPPSPPPSSPPPPPPPPGSESDPIESSGDLFQYQWLGALCKSGVHYCTIQALRVDSEACKYSNPMSEPTEWPAKLDMNRRTDFQHVQTTFTNSPPHKREICMLVPSSPHDHKGFQDFITYLKKRECVGVIKLPPSKSIWSRLLFILPYSDELRSMLSVALPQDSLVALLLPKETNCEWL